MFSRMNFYKSAAEDYFPQQSQHHAAQVPRERRGVSALIMLQQQQQLQQMQQQQLAHGLPIPRCLPVTGAQHHAQTQSRPLKVKQVLPCFNLICTGTCAYGPKCTFLHDPRAQLPKHIRKQAEFMLQSHLHTYRPNLNKLKQQQQLQSVHGLEEDECSSCHTDKDSECSSNNGEVDSYGNVRSSSPSCVWEQQQQQLNKCVAPTQTFKNDNIFAFPTMELTYQEPNSKCYDPSEEQIPSYSREMSMWYNFLGTVNEKYGNNASMDACHYGRRLPVFERLGHM